MKQETPSKKEPLHLTVKTPKEPLNIVLVKSGNFSQSPSIEDIEDEAPQPQQVVQFATPKPQLDFENDVLDDSVQMFDP